MAVHDALAELALLVRAGIVEREDGVVAGPEQRDVAAGGRDDAGTGAGDVVQRADVDPMLDQVGPVHAG